MVMRLNGFSSGMDIDSTVKQLMAARRIPLDKILQKKQTLQWKQDGYREMNSKLLDLRDSAFKMKLQSTYLAKKTSSNDESAISAVGTSSATDGIYKINIAQLAEAASATSTGSVGTNIKTTSKIVDVDPSLDADPLEKGDILTTLTIGGEKGTATIEVNDEATVASFISSVNSKSALTGVKVSFDDTMKRFFFVSTSTGANSKVELNSTNDNFLANVLKLTGSPETAEKVTGDADFMTTPAPAPDLTLKVDSSLSANQTFTIGYNGTNFSVPVTSSITIGALVESLNSDTSFKATGIVAGIDSITGVLTFRMPSNTKPITFSDSSGGGIVNKLGLPTTPTSSDTVTGAAYMTVGPDYVDYNKIINTNLTEDQTFRIAYDLDGDGTKENYDFTVNKNTTIGSLINNINSSNLGKIGGVNARLDSTTGKLILISPDNTKHFTLSDESAVGGDVIGSLGFTNYVNDPSSADVVDMPYSQVKNVGKNASIKYNDVEVEYASNTFTINGINITAKKVTGTDPILDPWGSAVNITVSQDVDSVYNSIKSFIDKYNEILNVVNTKTSEERFRDYAPLTDEQKEAMEEKDITLWEEKAKSGLLRSDPIMTQAITGFRSDWYQSVSGLANGDYRQLSDVGITTLEYSEKGKLYIDESKLRAALAKDSEAVMRLFTSDDGNAKTTSGDGVAVRIYNDADRILSQLKTKAGTASSLLNSYNIGLEIKDLNKSIATWQRRLEDIEDQYYKQFTAMETAMNKYNSQSSYLSQLTATK